ncbi:Structural maintenance of chromosomes protein 6 [Steccherinum ochraceum]|uniref:Structural maintenance of chromosomes protein 6 n=1 Tax=Steccherinum ochraceum TaxID=92696 RepID=A0A4R0RKL5_9APHY|nr:Structural maintenance of chromosomes protein 6 [Steccherinum ochraceum]
MPKRRAAVNDSDSEGESPVSQGSKRARTDDSEYNAAAGPSQDPRGQGRTRHGGDEGEDEEPKLDEYAPDEDEEKRFEEENEEHIRLKVLNKAKNQGGIAEMGIIEKLEMHQFMCHKYLTFTFGPQINFIIGHNGSGKSAVLSALTVALGGKATTTGRGNGLKAFIKEGQSAAEVTVTIKNQGDEAFKHDEYGDSIVITRKFTKDGTSSYRICAKNGNLVSHKREELSAICDHMNIQVDNPMNILTQDSARQFLSASAPADKYKFFLRGTQLSQLSEEYSLCLENITQMQKSLVHKGDAVPDLEDAVREAAAKYEEAKKARRQKDRLDELNKELAWSYVVGKQKEYSDHLGKVESQRRRCGRYDTEIEKEKAEIESLGGKITELEAQISELGDVKELQAEKDELQKKIREGAREIHAVQNDIKQINDSLGNTKSSIQSCQSRIEEETRKQQTNTQGKRDEVSRKLQETVDKMKEAETDLEEVKARHATLGSQKEQLVRDAQTAETENQQNEANMNSISGQLRNCDEQEKNKLAPFGYNMNAVLSDIDRTRWNGEKPIGPFGMFVTVKDRQWADILRNQLGNSMSSFAVTDPRDRPQLAKLLNHHKNHNVQIIITERDLFDYSQGEPPSHFMTVLRALEVSDEFVLRILINQNKIESTMLAPSRREADDMLLDFMRGGGRGGGLVWTNDLYRVQRYSEGGGSSSVLNRLRLDDRRQMLFQEKNIGSRKIELQQQLQELQDTRNRLTTAIQQHRDARDRVERELVDVAKQGRALTGRMSELRLIRAALQEEINEDTPVQIAAFQEEIERLNTEKDGLLRQFADIDARRLHLEEAQKPLVADSDRLKHKINEHTSSIGTLRDKATRNAQARLQAQRNKDHWEQKKAEENAALEKLESDLGTLEQELALWRGKAEEICEEFTDPRATATIKRDIASTETALKEREKKQGASVEEVTIELNKRQAILEKTKTELKSMVTLNRALRKSIRIRLKKWHEFRRHIALRCKIYFGYHLSVRGYYGKVLFDHVNGTLQLKVQTDEQHATQSREKDPRSLSGGEKSFSTICLLLSLWESIGCPIRCLDEFDVFMDAVNRRVSMKMMIETANASDRKQYILITPQDMTNVTIGPSVRVHRMSDPERGQGVLSM